VIAGYDGLRCFIRFFYFPPKKYLLKENSDNLKICENNIIGVELVVQQVLQTKLLGIPTCGAEVFFFLSYKPLPLPPLHPTMLLTSFSNVKDGKTNGEHLKQHGIVWRFVVCFGLTW
jgi:hypothetical protein